ncbi:hypothetical protein FQZ97_656740 [compost metagenome]
MLGELLQGAVDLFGLLNVHGDDAERLLGPVQQVVLDGLGDDLSFFNVALFNETPASHPHKLHAEFVRFAVR